MDHKELTQLIIGCAFRVYNIMGFGYLESVYEKCLVLELQNVGLSIETQKAIKVFYKGSLVGEFIADMIVNDTIIIELKSVKQLIRAHEVQLVNYLVATGKPIGLLINFGESKVEIKRKYKNRI